jgi:hypothetical protein
MKSPLTGAIGPVQDKSGKNKKQVHSYPAVTNDPVSIGFTDQCVCQGMGINNQQNGKSP